MRCGCPSCPRVAQFVAHTQLASASARTPSPAHTVAEFTGNDYADAQSKGHGVSLLTVEVTGAVSPVLDRLLRHLDRLSRLPTTVDHTQYNTTSRSAPHRFYDHHLEELVTAVVYADATTWLNAAASEAFQLTHCV